MLRGRAFILILLPIALLGVAAHAQDAPVETTSDEKSDGEAHERPQFKLKHLTFNRDERFVDLDAKVCRRKADWLELIACTPGTKEHESIVTVSARPRDIGLALVLIGLEPGSPIRWREKEDGDFEMLPPTGAKVAVSYVIKDKRTDRMVEIPANRWVLNQKTGKVMPDNVWLFTGSVIYEEEDSETGKVRKMYSADQSGVVISIVNFGDEVMCRPTDMTRENDESTWGTNTEAIPAVGTELIVRLRPIEPLKDEDGEKGDAEQPHIASPAPAPSKDKDR